MFLGIVGSPRKGQLTDKLVSSVLDAGKDLGTDTEKVYLADYKIDHYEEKGKTYTSEFAVEPGGIFGEMSLFTGMPRTATGIVEKESELLEIDTEDFSRILEKNPKVADIIADLVSKRNKKNQEFLKKIKELSEQDIKTSTSKRSILNRLKNFIKRL